MKVTHITTLDKSGAGRAAIRIVQALQSLKVNTVLLCLFTQLGLIDGIMRFVPKRNNLFKRILYRLGLRKRDYEQRAKLFSKYHVVDGMHWLHSDLRVDKHTTIKQADIIHLHWIDQMIDLSSFLEHTTQPIVWTLHDMGAFSGVCNYYYAYCSKFEQKCGACPALSSNIEDDLSRREWKMKYDLYRKHLQRLHIVTCSNWLADCARKSSLLCDVDIQVIPNCIDIDVYKPTKKKKQDNVIRFMLGAVNAKDPNKGYERLQHIVNKFASRVKQQIEVLVVGQNSEDLSFHENVIVKSFGFVEKDSDLATIYNQADLLLYGSYRDNLPNMIMEAMACGVPVVAFPVGGIPDMIIHEKTGYLADTEEDYIHGIQWCLDNKENLSIASRNKVLNDYHPMRVANLYYQLYEKIDDRLCKIEKNKL